MPTKSNTGELTLLTHDLSESASSNYALSAHGGYMLSQAKVNRGGDTMTGYLQLNERLILGGSGTYGSALPSSGNTAGRIFFLKNDTGAVNFPTLNFKTKTYTNKTVPAACYLQLGTLSGDFSLANTTRIVSTQIVTWNGMSPAGCMNVCTDGDGKIWLMTSAACTVSSITIKVWYAENI